MNENYTSNYCLIKSNTVYKDIYNRLEEECLSMDNPDDETETKIIMDNILDNMKEIIIFSKNYKNNKDALEDIMVDLSFGDKSSKGNTVLLYANDTVMYEAIYLEPFEEGLSDEYLNQYVTMSNIDLHPIYLNSVIIKSSYGKKSIIEEQITLNDIKLILIKNFYHNGVMIDTENTMTEIQFTGDEPFKMIGPTFMMTERHELFGLIIIGWTEKNNSTVENIVATQLFDKKLFGRVFIGLMCPTTGKKFWCISKQTINNLLCLINKTHDKYTKETEDKMYENPFYLINKYL